MQLEDVLDPDLLQLGVLDGENMEGDVGSSVGKKDSLTLGVNKEPSFGHQARERLIGFVTHQILHDDCNLLRIVLPIISDDSFL